MPGRAGLRSGGSCAVSAGKSQPEDWLIWEKAVAARLGDDQKLPDGQHGHYILNCAFGPMNDPKETAHHLDPVVGLIEHGLF